MRLYPRMLYRAGAGAFVDGIECAALVVHSEAEQVEALADGWGFVAHAEPAKPAEPADDAPPTRAELEAKATELGVKFDGRWGDKRLSDAIAAALKG
jgi:hypothetical protein